ncbi:MAG: DMT family transporter [Nitriliruptorales bacterium]
MTAARGGLLSPERRWTLALLAVTFVWGSTFVVVKEAVDRLPVLSFNAWRFAIAAIALGWLARRELPLLGRDGLRRGVILGAALWAAYVLQTFGLTLTTAPKAGFITGMVVVITPLLQSGLLRRVPSSAALGGAGLAFGGLALLTLEGALVPSLGDLLVLGCAVGFSLHLVGLGAWSGAHPSGALATVQLATTAVLSAAGGLVQDAVAGPFAWTPPGAYVWGSIVFTALFASAFAFFAQTAAQRVLSPTRTAVIFTMEPVFAWLTSWLGVPLLLATGMTGLEPETFGVRQGVGAAVILAGMLWAELRTGEPPDALAAPETATIVDHLSPSVDT